MATAEATHEQHTLSENGNDEEDQMQLMLDSLESWCQVSESNHASSGTQVIPTSIGREQTGRCIGLYELWGGLSNHGQTCELATKQHRLGTKRQPC